jgi:hypothetical protein
MVNLDYIRKTYPEDPVLMEFVKEFEKRSAFDLVLKSLDNMGIDITDDFKTLQVDVHMDYLDHHTPRTTINMTLVAYSPGGGRFRGRSRS